MLFYRVFIVLYPLVARVLGISSQKARNWVTGRKGLFSKLSSAFQSNKTPVIWMHCASLGEFEQGLPVLENIRQQYPGHRILLTFFSPSGYEVRKNFNGVDDVFYLPMDSPANARKFFDIVQPSLILFVKYEFWYYYLSEAKQRNIPLLLVSGIFRNDQPFFKWYGGFYKRILQFFSAIFVQNDTSAGLLKLIGFENQVIISGDTRFDRVITIANRFEPIDTIGRFCGVHPVVVAGSNWTDDDEELDHFANTHPQIKFIIAPHDIGSQRLDECLTLYRHATLYSAYEAAVRAGEIISNDINVLVIDNMGMLSRLYHYATICYVGGGFGEDGIHNVLEAAVYGKPVVFGPVYDKYFEADGLIDYNAGFSVENALELEETLEELLRNKEMYQEAATGAAAYVRENAGATGKVMRFIQEKRLLIN